MFENLQNECAKAILCSVDTGEYDADVSMDELEELAESADAEVIARLIQKRSSFETATFLGQGKLSELSELCKDLNADLLIFDHELTAVQIRNIENATEVRVVDRTTLILDIFARRAASAEGKLQVELAQQKYRLPRLTGMGVSMSRLGGGIGTRGPGETKLETDKRHIRRRIETLEEELRELSKRRELGRNRRKKDNITVAAIVGYTNAGKSTLLNKLTNAEVFAENMLFATLDTTSRSLILPDGRTILLTDTVGLIRRLPHNLVEAFKSTLEEAANADIILNVIDVSDEMANEHAEVTKAVLSELGCDGIPQINVLNKCDKSEESNIIQEDITTVKISAKNGYGLDRLLSAISENLPVTSYRMKLLIPYDKSSLLNKIRTDGKVFSEDYDENGTIVDALVDRRIFPLVQDYKFGSQE